MTRRTVLLFVALAAVLATVAFLFRDAFDDAKVFRPVDYMEYYAAGRATLNRQNPYDGAVIYPYQVEVQAKLPPPVAGVCDPGQGEPGSQTPATDGPPRYADPIMMWNPPWALPLTLPLGVMPWRAGQLLWTAANLVAVVVSAVLLWRAFGGSKERTTVAVGVAVLFAPTLFLLLLGQISGFLLLGLAGFLWCVRSNELRPPGSGNSAPLPGGRGSYWLAGLFAALTAIKPHLLVPFALVLLLETLRGGRAWRSVVAGGVALVVFGAIPLLWNPDVWTQYREATAAQSAGTHNTPNEWMHPTLGYWLRTLHPDHPFALMFLPLAVALPVVAVYWWLRRKDWNWATELPRLVLVSLLTAPYGAWGFDLVLLLVPVVQAAVWVANDRRKYVWLKFGGAFAALTLLALFTLRFENSMANWWLTPAVTAGYVLAAVLCHRREVASETGGFVRNLAAMTDGTEALPS